MPAARAASSREAPSSTSARASIRRAARASRHRAASRRRSPAPGSRRVIAIVIRALPCRRPTTDQPRRAPRGSGRDNTSGIQAVGITPALGALAKAVLDGQQLLPAAGVGADQHQQALPLVLEPGREVDAVGPEIDVAP